MGPLNNLTINHIPAGITISHIPTDVITMNIFPYLPKESQKAVGLLNREFFNLTVNFFMKKKLSVEWKNLFIIEGLAGIIFKNNEMPISMKLKIDSYKKKMEFLEKNQKESHKEVDKVSIPTVLLNDQTLHQISTSINLLKNQILNQISEVPEFSLKELAEVFSKRPEVLEEVSSLVSTYIKIGKVLKDNLMINDYSYNNEFNFLLEKNMLIKARILLERMSVDNLTKGYFASKLFNKILEKEGIISSLEFFESVYESGLFQTKVGLFLKKRDYSYFKKECVLTLIKQEEIESAIEIVKRLEKNTNPIEIIEALLKANVETKEIISLACLFNEAQRSEALEKIAERLKNPLIEDLEMIAEKIPNSISVLEKCVIQYLEKSDLSKAEEFIDRISSLKASVPLASSSLLAISRKLLEKGHVQFVLSILDKMEFNSEPMTSTKSYIFKELLPFFVKNKEIEKAEDLVEKIFQDKELPFKEMDTVFFEFFKALFENEQYSLERLEKMIVDRLPFKFKNKIESLICTALVNVDKNALRAKKFIDKREGGFELRESLLGFVAKALIPIDRNKTKEILEELVKCNPKFQLDMIYYEMITFLISEEQLKIEQNSKEVIEFLNKISRTYLINDFLQFYIPYFMNGRDPEIAVQLINDGPDFPDKEEVCKRSFKRLMASNPKLAQEIIETIRDEQLREKMRVKKIEEPVTAISD